jgi:hypothetical protein
MPIRCLIVAFMALSVAGQTGPSHTPVAPAGAAAGIAVGDGPLSPVVQAILDLPAAKKYNKRLVGPALEKLQLSDEGDSQELHAKEYVFTAGDRIDTFDVILPENDKPLRILLTHVDGDKGVFFVTNVNGDLQTPVVTMEKGDLTPRVVADNHTLESQFNAVKAFWISHYGKIRGKKGKSHSK